MVEDLRTSPPPITPAQPAAPRHLTCSRRSAVGLDWFAFFLADIQTGFGPFVSIYLTGQSWTQVDIGLVLTAGGLVALIGQMPGGALIDAVRSARLAAALAVGAICVSALALALWPVFGVVLAARVLHAGASCVLGPALAAISLGLVGHAGLGERLGRNARFASIGNGVAAALMGACGYLLSNRSIFLATALLVLPALAALARIRPADIDAPFGQGIPKEWRPRSAGLGELLASRHLLVFAGCMLLFQLANAAMLPLTGSLLALHAGPVATSVIAACVVVPQLIVAVCSPWIGRQAQRRGRRPLLLLCFVALVLRGVCFALVGSSYAVVGIQVFDGISAAVLGVLFPLIVADLTRSTGRFNLALGIVGSAVGTGAALSTTIAGYLLDHFGATTTFLGLAGTAGAGLLLVWAVMPETRPDAEIADV